MKVRCLKTLDPRGESIEKSPWLTIGQVYRVLSIEFSGGSLYLRVVGDDPYTPALFSHEQFEVVDGTLPKNWVLSSCGENQIEIGPAPWAATGFWVRFFDQDPAAKEIFKTQKDLIEAEN